MREYDIVVEKTESQVPVGFSQVLNGIRPSWQAKNLIVRTDALLKVDPSSACQRIFNATIFDLRDKVVVAGIDIASSAAKQLKLPDVKTIEDVRNYPIGKIIELSYGIGIISRPEWKRLARSYEIRCDLEHEDNEYIAGIEDCMYIFKTCIDAVLSRDPITILRVIDIKDTIEQPNRITPGTVFLEDYQHAPDPRQEEIMKFLISSALDKGKPEIIRENAFIFVRNLGSETRNAVKLNLVNYYQDIFGNKNLDNDIVRVMHSAGILPYIHTRKKRVYFEDLYQKMELVGYGWKNHPEHGDLLRIFKEIGGVANCPESIRKQIVAWFILVYIGESGGYGYYGAGRQVFYSNTAAPIVYEILIQDAKVVVNDLSDIMADKSIHRAIKDSDVKERFEQLIKDITNATQ